jgi:hypothetical protein
MFSPNNTTSSIPFCDPSSPFHDGHICSLLPHRACRLANSQNQRPRVPFRGGSRVVSSSASENTSNYSPKEATTSPPQALQLFPHTPPKSLKLQKIAPVAPSLRETGSPTIRRKPLASRPPSANINYREREIFRHGRQISAPPKLQGYRSQLAELTISETVPKVVPISLNEKPLPAPPRESAIRPYSKQDFATAGAQVPSKSAVLSSSVNSQFTPVRGQRYHPRTPAPLLLVPLTPKGTLETASLDQQLHTPDSLHPWLYTPQVSVFEDDDDDERIGLMDYFRWPRRYERSTPSKSKFRKIQSNGLKDCSKLFCWPCGRN